MSNIPRVSIVDIGKGLPTNEKHKRNKNVSFDIDNQISNKLPGASASTTTASARKTSASARKTSALDRKYSYRHPSKPYLYFNRHSFAGPAPVPQNEGQTDFRRNDPFGIPACFYWTADEVADWVESVGYAEYKEKFRSHFINGRKLMTVNACILPDIGVCNFEDIRNLSRLIRDQLHIKRTVTNWSPWPPHTRREYIGEPRPTGTQKKAISYTQHVREVTGVVESRLKCIKKLNLHYNGWTMQPGWDQDLKDREKQQGRRLAEGMQERLRTAALMAVGEGAVEHVRTLHSKTGDDHRIRNMSPQNESDVSQKPPKKMPYLPTVFIWQKQKISKGYPVSIHRPNIC